MSNIDPLIKQAETIDNLEALGAAAEAIDFLKRELRGALLVTSILVTRAGGRVEISQEEFDNVDPNTRLRVLQLVNGSRAFVTFVQGESNG